MQILSKYMIIGGLDPLSKSVKSVNDTCMEPLASHELDITPTKGPSLA